MSTVENGIDKHSHDRQYLKVNKLDSQLVSENTTNSFFLTLGNVATSHFKPHAAKLNLIVRDPPGKFEMGGGSVSLRDP